MNEFFSVKKYFQDKYPKDTIDLIQYSRNPLENDVIHFLLFRNAKLFYIVSTYRNNSNERLCRENALMKKLLSKIECSGFRETILFNTNLISSTNRLFRIQKYVDNKPYRKKLKTYKHEFLLEIIEKSSLWLNNIQALTPPTYSDSSEITDEINLLFEEYNSRLGEGDFLIDLRNKMSQLKLKLKKSFVHGDFCPYNYFYKEEKFLVFDWEYISSNYWSFYDPILNFTTIWISLYGKKRVCDIPSLLDGEAKNKDELVLANYARSIIKKNEISSQVLMLLIVFVYFKNYLRKEIQKPPSTMPFTSKLIELLYY